MYMHASAPKQVLVQRVNICYYQDYACVFNAAHTLKSKVEGYHLRITMTQYCAVKYSRIGTPSKWRRKTAALAETGRVRRHTRRMQLNVSMQ